MKGNRAEKRNSFLDGGSIPPPGPIGRSVRLLLGIGALYLVFQVSGISDARAISHPLVIVHTLFAIYLVGYVVNIGFGVRLGQLPRIAALIGLAIASLIGWQSASTLESVPLWQAVYWLNLYVYGHLGVSFLLAAAFGTPGCEMRSIPIMASRLSGGKARDHHCPGPIGRIDRWEERLTSRG